MSHVHVAHTFFSFSCVRSDGKFAASKFAFSFWWRKGRVSASFAFHIPFIPNGEQFSFAFPVQQSGNQNVIRQWCSSLSFIPSLQCFPFAVVLLKVVRVEFELLYFGESGSRLIFRAVRGQ